MGAVKQHFHDEICARFDDYGSPEPDDLELLAIDAEQAKRRYEETLKAAKGRSIQGENNERRD